MVRKVVNTTAFQGKTLNHGSGCRIRRLLCSKKSKWGIKMRQLGIENKGTIPQFLNGIKVIWENENSNRPNKMEIFVLEYEQDH